MRVAVEEKKNSKSCALQSTLGVHSQRLGCPHHPACAHLWQVRVNRVHWLDSQGPTYARARSEALYNGETYVMGIDSHTNFAEGWDTIMIDMFRRIANPKAIITAYPHAYPNSQQDEGGDNAVVQTEPTRMTPSLTLMRSSPPTANSWTSPACMLRHFAGFSTAHFPSHGWMTCMVTRASHGQISADMGLTFQTV